MSNYPYEPKKKIMITIQPNILKDAEDLVSKGYFRSRSSLIQRALELYFQELENAKSKGVKK